MIHFEECDISVVQQYITPICNLRELSNLYAIYQDGVLVGTFGYIYTRALDVDRIMDLTVVIDPQYRNKGLFSIIGQMIIAKLIDESKNGKIWILTQMLNRCSRLFSNHFGFINLNNNYYYLYHNTEEDELAKIFANKTIKLLNKIREVV